MLENRKSVRVLSAGLGELMHFKKHWTRVTHQKQQHQTKKYDQRGTN